MDVMLKMNSAEACQTAAAAKPASLKDEIEQLKQLLAAKEAELLAQEQKKVEKKKEEPKEEAGGDKPSKKDLKKLEKQKAKDAKKAAGAAAQGPAIEFDPNVFGPMPLIDSAKQTPTKITSIADITPEMKGQTVTIRARIAATRKASAKLLFLVLRKNVSTIQCVAAEAGGASRDMIKWGASIPTESVVELTGTVDCPEAPVTACTVSLCELKITKLFLVSASEPVLPFQVADAAGLTEGISVDDDTRLKTRWLDMRTPANQAIWRLKSKVCQYFREYLTGDQFVEIQTPKIIPAASEGGASVFKLGYFGKQAYLAQSPQLYKQMVLQGDLNRVFEVGPVFRAEDSNTHRHLCEFVGLDVEMEIKEHYYEVLDVAEGLFTYIFDHLSGSCQELIDTVQGQWKQTPFVHKLTPETIEKLGLGIVEGEGARESKDEYKGFIRNLDVATLRMSYPDAVRLLNVSLAKDGEETMQPTDDLSTPNEKRLGALVKERYGVDFFILDLFPAVVRPFYTMPYPKDERFSNSYDMFMRGEEISSGAQRIHDAELLLKKGIEKEIDMVPLKDYVESFKLGAWPHGGFGIGLERVVMLYLGLKNIRQCTLFSRCPRRNTP
eukprot:TRINITY_DN5447_c0_g1_i1.p1 TRINITY_DN5447_c0_g1~~TRINITY_DN5447_c0_g1_i1.p1  ORF type:complete len:621 (+),score=283.73 TRINITY_DN5447_c0_g1_i1:39-1865(+)